MCCALNTDLDRLVGDLVAAVNHRGVHVGGAIQACGSGARVDVAEAVDARVQVEQAVV